MSEQSLTTNELHRRQERIDANVHEHSRQISDLERGYARLEAKLDGLAKTVNKHSEDSEREMKSIDGKLDKVIGSFPNSRFEQVWGGIKLIGFVLMLLGAISAAVVALL